jgi:hypothetical protein
MAQNEIFDATRIAHHLHVPAQVVQAARWQIPTLVLIRRPRDAVLSFALSGPDIRGPGPQILRIFLRDVEKYRDAYVLGLFEEVTEDFGQVIRRINDKFGPRSPCFVTTKRTSASCLPAWRLRPERSMARRCGSARFNAPQPLGRE